MNKSNLSDDALAELMTLTVTVTKDGTRYRNSDGQLHRVHGPAVISSRGGEGWYQNGKRHRIDGPALIWADGTQFWYQNGMLHRTDGPALIWTDGGCEWWLNDKELTAEEYNERINTTR